MLTLGDLSINQCHWVHCVGPALSMKLVKMCNKKVADTWEPNNGDWQSFGNILVHL